MAKNRTEVADIDRSLYDFRYGEEGFERLDAGLTPDIVREISERKNEPAWMLERRLKSLEIYHNTPNPTWGPGIEGLDMDHIVTYVKPNTDQKNDWESVPDDIKDTFERLGIPEAERSYLAGVGAQYDSELVYHNMQDTAAKMGIVYSGIEEALQVPEWEAIIREKFSTPSSWSRTTRTCTSSRAAPRPSTTWPTCMRALSSSSWASVRTCGTRPSRTGRRTCTT